MKKQILLLALFSLCHSTAALAVGQNELNYNRLHRPLLPQKLFPITLNSCKTIESRSAQTKSKSTIYSSVKCLFADKYLYINISTEESLIGESPFKVVYQIENSKLINEFDSYRIFGGCSVAELNSDKQPDFICEWGAPVVGIGTEKRSLSIILSGTSSHKLSALESWSVQDSDFFRLDPRGEPYFMHTTFIRGGFGNYWVYHILGFEDGSLIPRNDKLDNFPVWIRYTKKENHKPDLKLKREIKMKMLKENGLEWLEP